MRLTKADFEVFKKECQRWIDLFGLGDKYDFMFEFREGIGAYADTEVNATTRKVLIRLEKDWYGDLPRLNGKEKELLRTAKHEAIHVLLGELDGLAQNRWVIPGDYTRVLESLVVQLVDHIKES